ncbi:AMP-binding enzyme family protein (macronuclear) [Tetrahymena thermophila SB210]|uniref:AMP-binding enzyme family protein n=1 Tax=Tetrahymena thermophila (strain SB210) TaxID=312017 RepID=Q22B34_TETTS|nr:AMP-binding enzyme family protein [Tetrahymena thermophila SB210]EAR82521.2 AMP-binding enzyme family protein [Tetrahymena thermophila SB210]|eukprot:XP_001030184.2 AMP-binding enzyme family protein [Tetrahymena thermophila SB210]
MIINNKLVYTLPISEPRNGETAVYRHPLAIDGFKYLPDATTKTIQDVIELAVKKYADREFIGSLNPSTGKYEYKSYKQIYDLGYAIGSGLVKLNLTNHVEEFMDYKLDVIGIYCQNREEWTICDMANAMFGFTMIPLYDTLGQDAISFVLEDSNITACYVSAKTLPSLLSLKRLHNLKTIISFDEVPLQLQQIVKQKGLNLIFLNQVIEAGKKNPSPKRPVLPSSIFTFSYTSGTTGNPKGVMITHKNVVAAITTQQLSDFRFFETDTHLSYLPLPHIFERFVNCTCWYAGCRIAFYSGNTQNLLQDCQAAQPTVFISVPRLFNRYYDFCMTHLRRRFSDTEIDFAIATKLIDIQEKGQYNNASLDYLMFDELKRFFGGKMRILLSSSAPISRKVLEFYKVALSCPVLEGYGQTEATGVKSLTVAIDPESGHVGGILPSLEMKLVDVPEMNYHATDKDEQGYPLPRGEICTRGASIFQQYYKQPSKTKETIDEEGWMHSGDIGVMLPNGAFKVIDRKKNIFKLSQGEYVAPEKVENIYVRARGVAEAFLYGDSVQNFCIGIIVPNPEEIKKIAAELNVDPNRNLRELCANPKIIQFYQKNILAHGKKEGLFTFEQAQRIYLEPESLQTHGCLTGSMKMQRHIANKVFKPVIDMLYSHDGKTEVEQLVPAQPRL